MTDSTRFETRLTDALGRYADRVPVEVDVERLVQSVSGPRPTSLEPVPGCGRPPRRRLSVMIAGLALFGGRLLAPVPPVFPSPSHRSRRRPRRRLHATSSPRPTHPRPLRYLSPWLGTGPSRNREPARGHQLVASRGSGSWRSVPTAGLPTTTSRSTRRSSVHGTGACGRASPPRPAVWKSRPGPSTTTSCGSSAGAVRRRIRGAASGRRATARRWERVANGGPRLRPGLGPRDLARDRRLARESRRGVDRRRVAGAFLLRSPDGAAWREGAIPTGRGPYHADGLASDGSGGSWRLRATTPRRPGHRGAHVQGRTDLDEHVVEVCRCPGNAAGAVASDRAASSSSVNCSMASSRVRSRGFRKTAATWTRRRRWSPSPISRATLGSARLSRSTPGT